MEFLSEKLHKDKNVYLTSIWSKKENGDFNRATEVALEFRYSDGGSMCYRSYTYHDLFIAGKNPIIESFMQHKETGLLCAWDYWYNGFINKELFRRIKGQEGIRIFKEYLFTWRVPLYDDLMIKPIRK